MQSALNAQYEDQCREMKWKRVENGAGMGKGSTRIGMQQEPTHVWIGLSNFHEAGQENPHGARPLGSFSRITALPSPNPLPLPIKVQVKVTPQA